jgi:hypothetical protein
MIPRTPQQIEWYLFPFGCGFLGANIQPGQVHIIVHRNIGSSKHNTQLELKHAAECLLKVSIISLKGWKGSLKAGVAFAVNFKCLRIASKRCLDMKACKRNGAPQKCPVGHLTKTCVVVLPELLQSAEGWK